MKRLFIAALLFMSPTLWAADATPAPTSTPIPASSPAPTENSILKKAQELEQAIPIIRQQVADTIQSVNMQEQKINEQIANLQMQNVQLYDQINRLSQQLNESHRQIVNEAQQQITTSHKISLMKWAGIAFIFSFLLVLITLIVPQLKKQNLRSIQKQGEPVIKPVVEEEIENEYDFMSSQEAVPVKIDLARAYLEMGENEAAREVLEAILAQGNEVQRAEAERLLSTVKTL